MIIKNAEVLTSIGTERYSGEAEAHHVLTMQITAHHINPDDFKGFHGKMLLMVENVKCHESEKEIIKAYMENYER